MFWDDSGRGSAESSRPGHVDRFKLSVHVDYTCILVVLYSFPVNAGPRPTRAKGRRGKNKSRSRAGGGSGRRGKTVIVLDTDPQASACRWRDRRQVPEPAVIDVQPARLQYALGAAAEQGVDLVVIDTPPRSESAALEAARVANLVVIPCRAQILDLETVPATQQLLALAGNPPAVAILSAVPPRGARAAQARRAIARFGLPVCPHTLGHRAAWGDSNALGLTVTEYPPRGRAAEEMRHVAPVADTGTRGTGDVERSVN